MYGKVFESMYDGTLASKGPWQALVTFQQMIVLANKDGFVDMTADAISRRTSIPLEIIKTGVEALLLPDPESRTPDEDGRRIVPIEDHRTWGWKIVNHQKYQALRRAEDRREYLRNAQSESRARKKTGGVTSQPPSTTVNTVNIASTLSTPEDVYAEAILLPTVEVGCPALRAKPATPPPAFDGTNAETLNGKAVVLLAAEFSIPEPWGVDAEALGFKPVEVLREGEKFRQYWTAGRGAGTRRSVRGWRQTWSTWLEKAAKDKR